MRMFQVDAFTDRLFAGNPAAVLVLDEWLSDSLMLSIAQENNLAETAFVKARSDGEWDLRWFAPAHEVDFCGHATLATAHVLVTAAGVQAPLVFHTRVGELRVAQVPRGYQLNIPCLRPEPLEALPRKSPVSSTSLLSTSSAISRISSPTWAMRMRYAILFQILPRSPALDPSDWLSQGRIQPSDERISCPAILPPEPVFPRIQSPDRPTPHWFRTGPSGWVVKS